MEPWDPAAWDDAGGGELSAAQRGDCHMHSDWSDGGSPVETMARAARDLGRQWAVLTDHSPRLTVAHGLSAERLRHQIEVVRGLNEELWPFRLLTGIECDILEDGGLDQEAELLDELDVVVASVHSRLRMDRAAMTERLVSAVSNPLVDVVGHCTGRIVSGRLRPESAFDADEVLTACAENRTALEINCRSERLDPPLPLLRRAADTPGLLFAVDTDAHRPSHLALQPRGCARAACCGIGADRTVTAWTADRMLAWTRDR